MPRDFLIGTEEPNKPVYIPDAIRCEHVTIIGATGTGKTTLLERMILSDIENETSCVVIDAHGDITRAVFDKAPPAAHLYLLEVWPDCPFGLNLFELSGDQDVEKRADEVLLVLKRMFGGEAEFRPQVDHDLNLIIRTLLANKDCTLAEALDLLTDKDFRERLTSRLTNRALAAAWRSYNDLRSNEQANRIAPLFNRLSPFLGSDLIRCIVGQSHTTVPLDEVFQIPGFTLLVSLPIGGTGSEARSKFLGSLLVCLLTQMIFDRAGTPVEKLNRLHLYLDEYGRYATPTTARLFGEGRKYNFSLTVAHQTRADMEGTGNESAELQAGTLICFHPATGEDADELAHSMPVTPRQAEEAPRAISQSPIRLLLEGKHESRSVQDFAVKFLHSIAEDPKPTRDSTYEPIHSYDRHQLTEGMELLNTLLVDVMKGDLDITSFDFSARSAEIARKCQRFLGLSYRVSALLVWDWDQWAQALVRRIVQHDPDPLHDPDIQDRIKKQLDREGDHQWYTKRKEVLRNEASVAYPFFVDLIRLCELLKREPVYISIPGHIARPQQTYADAQAELADQMKRLPKYHAFVRIRLEGPPIVSHVWTPLPLLYQGSPAWQRRNADPFLHIQPDPRSLSGIPKERLDKYRKWFGTPRDEVEAEIDQRRQKLMRPPPDNVGAPRSTAKPKGPPPPVSPPPRIARRSPKH